MTSTNQTNFDPALKQIYRPKRIQDLTYDRRPMLGMCPKFENFEGRDMPVVLKHGNPQGISAVFATAQTNRTQLRVQDFVLTRVNRHGVATVDGETAESSRSNAGAFLNALSASIDGTIKGVSDSLESYMPRSGTGAIGTVGALSSMDLTLAILPDQVNFEVGMEVVASTADGGALRDTGDGVTVTAINRNTSVLTSDENWSAIASIATTDFLYREGDANNNSSDVVTAGFEGWVPATAPDTTAYFGVDRSVDTVRLGGNRYDGTSDVIEDALINGQSVVANEGGAVDTYFINHLKNRQLSVTLGSKARYNRRLAKGGDGDVAHVGFTSIVIDGDRGPIDVVAANKCQRNTAWGLEMNTWSMNTIGKCVRISDLDGNRILRQASDDGVEVRVVHRGNLSCDAPGHNVRVGLSTT